MCRPAQRLHEHLLEIWRAHMHPTPGRTPDKYRIMAKYPFTWVMAPLLVTDEALAPSAERLANRRWKPSLNTALTRNRVAK